MRYLAPRALQLLLGIFLLFGWNLSASADEARITGRVLDPQGAPVAQAHVKLVNAAGAKVGDTHSDEQGRFALEGVDPGVYQLVAESPSFVAVIQSVSVAAGQQQSVDLQFQQLAAVHQSITVVASAPSIMTPDPAQSIVIHDQVLDANPGRPGAPISIPGLPIETASGGIKAPQYFAPGVAGDHGEPIGQFFQIGNYLYPNNLPANAHGNGYADPNFLIPPIIEAVTVDGGAFNVREGNNSVDLAAAYLPRQRAPGFLQLTGDYRDADLMAGWNPKNPRTNAWLAAELSFGNGFLERLEHRQQYKLNGLRQFNLREPPTDVVRHRLLRLFLRPGTNSHQRPCSRRHHRQSATRRHAHFPCRRHGQLEAQRTETVFFLRFLSQLRSHAALQFRRWPHSAE